MDTGTILIVGRGKSAYDFDWSTVDCPIMAVSSGIFAVPRYRCNHFVTLDEPKYFMAQLMANSPHAWEHDKSAEHWPFWTDINLVKHVPEAKLRTMKNLIMPVSEIILAIDEWAEASGAHKNRVNNIKKHFYATLGEEYSQFGLQPGWADYHNVKGYKIGRKPKPDWFGDGPIQIPRAFNSLFMAVQVATRLGYKQLRFIGVDLDQEFYKSVVVILKRWHLDGDKHGITWVNHSPQSSLRDFVTNDFTMDMADAMVMLAQMGALEAA